MNDLLFWEQLASLPADDPKLGQQILAFEKDRQQGQLKRDRWVFVGDLLRVLPRQSAEVRAAILRILVGHRGKPTIESFVGRIRKDSPSIGVEAINSLSLSGPDLQWQLVHAFFSPDLTVRREALAKVSSGPTVLMALHLIADSELRDEAIEAVSGKKLPVTAIETVYQFYQQRTLDAREAKRLISGIHPQQQIDWIKEKSFDHEDAEKWLSDFFEGKPLQELTPLVQWLFDLNCDPDLRAVGSDHQTDFLDQLGKWLLYSDQPEPTMLLAMLLWMSGSETWPPEMLELAIWLDLRVLKSGRVAAEQIRDAFVSLCARMPKGNYFSEGLAQQLLQDAKFARRPTGQLDLAVLGGLLNFFKSSDAFFKVYTQEQVVAAFLESPVDSLSFLSSNIGEKSAKEVIEKIWKQANGKKNRNRICVLLATRVSLDQLKFLDLFAGLDWQEFVCQLVPAFASLDVKPATRRRAELLVSMVVSKLPNGLESAQVLFETVGSETNPFCIAWLEALGKSTPPQQFLDFAMELPTKSLQQMLKLIEHAAGFSYLIESTLVSQLTEHPQPAIADWARQRIESVTSRAAPRKIATEKGDQILPQKLSDRIQAADEAGLPAAIVPCLAAPKSGLVAVLAGRKSPPENPMPYVVVALVVTQPVPQADQQIGIYESPTADGFERVCELMVKYWNGSKLISLTGHALLWRWEFHLFQIDESIDALTELTSLALERKSKTVVGGLWRAASRLAAVQAARDRARFSRLVSGQLVEDCLTALVGDQGVSAAEILVTIHRTQPDLVHPFRGRAIEAIPSLKKDVRQALSRWVSVEGIREGESISRAHVGGRIDDQTIAEISACDDLSQLANLCRDSNWKVVDQASSRLLQLGSAGIDALVQVILEVPVVERVEILCETLPFWEVAGQQAMHTLREAVCRGEVESPYLRFLISMQLLLVDSFNEDADLASALIESINQPVEVSWFVVRDWNRAVCAVKNIMDELELSMAVVTSAQTHAYLKAIHFLVSGGRISRDHVLAVKAFLSCGTERAYDSRVAAARWLAREGESFGFPILAATLAKESDSICHGTVEELRRISKSVMAVGDATLEANLIQGVADCQIRDDFDPSDARKVLEWVVAKTGSVRIVEMAIGKMNAESEQSKLSNVAKTFKWGIDQGWELLNQKFKISMLAGEDLGYTRLNENKVFVNIMPMMENQQHGKQVVEGLILHELGHHIYHKGPSKQKVWERAQEEGLHKLLNLVSDEHLERNLRAKGRQYDIKLKQLASHAFYHTKRSYDVARLLELLGTQAFAALQEIRLAVADHPFQVEVESGRLLNRLEKVGSSFSRFFRSLRMGLGNRMGDPKVEQALALFDRKFRDSSMKQLYQIAKQLREIFTDDPCMNYMLSQDEMLSSGELASAKNGGGLTDEMVQREIHRITSREELAKSKSSGTTGGRSINVIDEIEFDPITNVVRMPFDAVESRKLRVTVARQAKMLRSFLVDLGEKYVQQRRRLNGYRLDRSAVKRLITHGDPRLMVARTREFRNDLFIGMAIDCSGSMAYNDNMELAKRFGALLCEAVRDIDGIDLNIVGFTDDAILDAGDKHRNSIFALHAGGGNNDAAALWHIAQKASSSQRSAKLLIMISDGLPTECSVDALRTLVRKLTLGFGIHCAQLAVEDLEEVCFPNYVLVKSHSEEGAIRKFGASIAKLVRQAIS